MNPVIAVRHMDPVIAVIAVREWLGCGADLTPLWLLLQKMRVQLSSILGLATRELLRPLGDQLTSMRALLEASAASAATADAAAATAATAATAGRGAGSRPSFKESGEAAGAGQGLLRSHKRRRTEEGVGKEAGLSEVPSAMPAASDAVRQAIKLASHLEHARLSVGCLVGPVRNAIANPGKAIKEVLHKNLLAAWPEKKTSAAHDARGSPHHGVVLPTRERQAGSSADGRPGGVGGACGLRTVESKRLPGLSQVSASASELGGEGETAAAAVGDGSL